MKKESQIKLDDKVKNNNPIPDKALKVIANSIYQNLKGEGCQYKDILGVSSQLIGIVTSEIEGSGKR